MANLSEVERLLDDMTAGEKALVLQRVVRDLGIVAHADWHGQLGRVQRPQGTT